MEKNIADILTYGRIVLCPFLILSAYFGKTYFFVGIYLICVASDILDGYFARKHLTASERGARLDIIADNIVMASVFVGALFIKPFLIIKYGYHMAALVLFFIFIQLISIKTTKAPIFMRTYAAQMAATLFPIMIILSLVIETKIVIYTYIITMYYSLTEKVFIKTMRKKTKTIFSLGMKWIIIFLIVLSALVYLVMKIPLIDNRPKVCFEDKSCISVDFARTEEEREIGLMFRKEMKENEGMIFYFDTLVRYSFWMKNMNFPIDLIFIGQDKKIMYIVHNATPCTKPDNECEIYTPEQNYFYVVETIAGFSEKHRLNEGSSVTVP